MTVPASWMPAAKMRRVIVHWTAGASKASALDRQHYHIMVEGDGTLVRGDKSIKLNEAPAKKGYAAHTLNCNSGSIGVSVCCMAGAIENPFAAGKHPMTKVQWDAMMVVVADLCTKYKIPVTPETVLSHAEVQGTLGIKQRGKWDIARLSFDPSVKGAKAVGDRMRREVKAAMGITVVGPRPLPPIEDLDEPPEPALLIEQPAELVESLDLKKGVAERAQKLLKEKGWYADGLVDDDAGPRTQAAILAFRNENDLPLKKTIDAEFMAALEAAPPRYIPPERAEMTVATMMAKDTTVAEPLRQNWWQKLVAWIVAIPSVLFGAFSGIMDFFGEATSKLDPLKAILSDVPVWVWFGLAAGVALTIWLGARRSDKGLADMTRTGKVA